MEVWIPEVAHTDLFSTPRSPPSVILTIYGDMDPRGDSYHLSSMPRSPFSDSNNIYAITWTLSQLPLLLTM